VTKNDTGIADTDHFLAGLVSGGILAIGQIVYVIVQIIFAVLTALVK